MEDPAHPINLETTNLFEGENRGNMVDPTFNQSNVKVTYNQNYNIGCFGKNSEKKTKARLPSTTKSSTGAVAESEGRKSSAAFQCNKKNIFIGGATGACFVFIIIAIAAGIVIPPIISSHPEYGKWTS